MSRRLSFLFAVTLLLIAAALRLWDLTTLPPGFSNEEIINIRITEAVRGGQINVFYDLGGEGREGLYHITLATITTLIGHGSIGYRLVSVGAGMITLALIYAVGLRLFGRLAALSSLALMSFGMFPTLLARQIRPETFLPMLTCGIILMLISALPAYRRRRVRGANTTIFASLGVFLGLGLYVHPAGLLVLIAAGAFIFYIVRFSNTVVSGRRTRYIRFALLLTLIIAIPYLTSSLRQPELNGFSRLFDGETFTLRNVGDSLAAIIILGDSHPGNNIPDRPLLDPVSVGLMLIALGYSLRRWRRPRYMILPLYLLILLPVAIFSSSGADFGAYAVVIPVIYLLAGFGASLVIYIVPVRYLAVGVGCLMVLLGVNVVWTFNDLYGRWGELPAVQTLYNARVGQLARYVDTHDTMPMVICGWSPSQSPSAARLSDAQLIDLMLNRQELDNIRYTECTSGLIFPQGGENFEVLIPNSEMLADAHPQITQWLAQGTFVDLPDMPEGSVLQMNVAEDLADALGAFTVTTPVSYAPETGDTSNFGPPVSFGGNVTFLGYATDDAGAYAPGSTLTLVTYWRVDGVVPPDLRFFTHVLADPGASPVANTDTLSTQARLLQNRDVVVQVTYVPLPSTLPLGEYRLSIGAYQDTSRIRLDVLREGAPFGNRLLLFPIVVAER
ncbi:MAG: glycosyltransferase family 39 protein [Aggregatilineales bacterium]